VDAARPSAEIACPYFDARPSNGPGSGQIDSQWSRSLRLQTPGKLSPLALPISRMIWKWEVWRPAAILALRAQLSDLLSRHERRAGLEALQAVSIEVAVERVEGEASDGVCSSTTVGP